eukprot:m.150348 g.150348  ORF g.150348 m.150348 type:complete len:1256 (+) comp13282_c0_seq2:125-3892(+)
MLCTQQRKQPFLVSVFAAVVFIGLLPQYNDAYNFQSPVDDEAKPLHSKMWSESMGVNTNDLFFRDRRESAVSSVSRDSLTNFWRIQQGTRASPSARIGSVIFTLSGTRQGGVIVVGGFSYDSFAFDNDRLVPMGDVWQYSVSSDNWVDLSARFSNNTPRGFHAITAIDPIVGAGFMFGGFTRPNPTARGSSNNPLVAISSLMRVDIFGHQLEMKEIQRPDAATAWPPPRAIHTFDWLSPEGSIQRCAVLFGGISEKEYLGDTWLMHSDTMVWTQVGETGDGNSPSPRYGHITFVEGNQLILLSGCSGNHTTCGNVSPDLKRDIWRFTLTGTNCNSGQWNLLSEFNIGLIPARVWGGNGIFYVDAEKTLYVLENLMGNDIQQTNALLVVKPVFEDNSTVIVDVDWTFKGTSLLSSNPPPRLGACATIVRRSTQEQVFMFGGGSEVGFLSDLWVYSIEPRFWSESAADFVQPLSLAHAAYTTTNGKLYISGGETWRGLLNLHLWSFDLETEDWAVVSNMLSPSTGASLIVLNHNWLFQYGGFSGRFGGGLTSIVTYLSLDGESHKSFNSELSRRAYTSAVYEPISSRVFIYGGWLSLVGISFQNARYSGELIVADINFNEENSPSEPVWRILRPSGESPGPLAGHIGVKMKTGMRTYMYMYGGCTPSGNLGTDVFKLNIDQPLLDLEWTKISVVSQRRPFAFMSSYVIFNTTVLTLGGLVPGVNGTWSSTNEMYLGFISEESFKWDEVLTVTRISQVFGATLALHFEDPPTITSIGGWSMENSVLSEAPGQRAVQVGCNPGDFSPSLAASPCLPCPIGSYAPAPGQRLCTQCPGISTTIAPGSFRVEDCNACADGTCINGDCLFEISSGGYRCLCDGGWGGSKCDVNVVGITLGTVFAMFVVAGVGYFVFRRVRHRFHHMRLYQDLQEQLIQESQQELTELKKAWEISSQDLKFKRPIDAGAFGEVWLASWQDRTVAVKKLKQSVNLFDERAVEDFNAEVSLIRSLRHRNVVFFYGAGVLDDCPFLVTEFMSRGSLSSILASDVPLSKKRCIEFALDTACGITFLHELDPPRIHRDLKSANLLVSDQWVVKVADFGTARLCTHVLPGVAPSSSKPGSTYSSTNMTTAVGTLVWSAPEVLDGKPYGPFADVFSFGVVLYEIATREVPYDEVQLPTWDLRTKIVEGLRPRRGLPPLKEEEENGKGDEDEGEEVEQEYHPLAVDESYVRLLRECWRTSSDSRPCMREARDRIEIILGNNR